VKAVERGTASKLNVQLIDIFSQRAAPLRELFLVLFAHVFVSHPASRPPLFFFFTIIPFWFGVGPRGMAGVKIEKETV
jgi:hypothetical protein